MSHPHETETQRARLLEALRAGPVSSVQAITELDVFRPSARIMELRRAGHEILTSWTTEAVPGFTEPHRIGRYVLLKESRSNG